MKDYKIYDLSELIKIQIPDILENYGIKLNRQNMFKLRDEKTPSAKYYPQTNSYNDFGSGRGGSPIHLIMNLEGFDKKEAIQHLGEMYNITIINNAQNIKGKCFLTNSQWLLLGIQGDRTSKNYEFDFENETQEYNLNLSRELGISMNDCAEMYPQTFIDIIENKSIPHVNRLKNIYQNDILALLDIKNMIASNKLEGTTDERLSIELFSSKVQESLSDYDISLNFLKKATKNIENIEIKFKPANFLKDYDDIKNGKIAVEIGPVPYIDFKKNVIGGNKYKKIDYEVYKEFVDNPKNEMFIELNPHSAFLKGNEVSMTIKEQHFNLYEELINETKMNMDKTIEKDYEIEV